MYTYLSAYALDRYEQCQRKFALSAIEELYWPAAEGVNLGQKAELGTRFHQWVQWHALGLEPDVPPEISGWVSHFLASEWARPPGRVLSEWDFFLEVAGVPLRGRFDRLQQEEDQWWIVDWKTGRFSDQITWRWQHRLYPLALVLAGEKLVGESLSPERVQMVYYFPEIGESFRFPYNTMAMQATMERLAGLAPRLAGPLAQFPMRDRGFCEKSGCSYLSNCYPVERPEAEVQWPLPQFK